MALINLNQTIDCDRETVLNVIADVKSYPDFLPWIESLRVSDQTTYESGSQFNALVRVGFKLFSESFATKVTIESPKSQDMVSKIEMNLIKGPFRTLRGNWSIQTLSPNQSLVKLDLRLEFSNPILGAVFDANQEKIAQKIMNIFTDRALFLKRKKTSI